MTIFVTGAAGFIGYHLSKRLIDEGIPVIALDNINPYYDVNLKISRLKNLQESAKKKDTFFKCIEGDLEDSSIINLIFKEYKPKKVVNLAAQAGVRNSIENPGHYIQSNIVGFNNILESCRKNEVRHLVYASSSSVYGGNKKMPFSEKDGVDHPVSLYAATKRSNELMAHSYSHLFGIPATGLRFFTVYGPWGRPDMALFLFTKAILTNQKIKVFNNGEMVRDFTYIEDIIEGIFRILNKPPKPNPNIDLLKVNICDSWAPHKIFNIGNSNPIPLMEFIEAIEKATHKTAKKEYLPMQPGDVAATEADTIELEKWISFTPQTSVEDGIKNFIKWYRNYYKI